jgi:hypothetical protein
MEEQVVPETAPAEVVVESAPTEEQAQEEQAANTGSAPEETPEEIPENTEARGAEPTGTPKAVQELISTRKRAQEAEARASAALAELEAMRAQQRQPKRIEKEPDLVNYESADAYQRDVETWNEQRVREKIRAEENDEKFRSRSAVAASQIPDYQQVISTTKVPIHLEVAQVIKESEKGPELFYFLAKNPTEAYRLAALNPLSAVREIGKIEAKLSQTVPPAKPKISQAPPPVAPLASGRTSVDTTWDAEAHTTEENIAHWNSERAARVPRGR